MTAQMLRGRTHRRMYSIWAPISSAVPYSMPRMNTIASSEGVTSGVPSAFSKTYANPWLSPSIRDAIDAMAAEVVVIIHAP